jgi:hypothetical protein
MGEAHRAKHASRAGMDTEPRLGMARIPGRSGCGAKRTVRRCC